MENKASHIIHKIYCEVLEASPERSQMLKNNLAEWLKSELLPLLERYLDQMDRTIENAHYQIPNLEININSSSKVFESSKASMDQLAKDHLLSQLKEQLEQQFQQLENKVSQAKSISKASLELDSLSKDNHLGLSSLDREIKSIIQILETGEKPWWLSAQEKIELFSDWSDTNRVKPILFHPKFHKLLERSGREVDLRRRFLKQFNYQQIKYILSAYYSKSPILTKGQDVLSQWPKDISSPLKSLIMDDIWRLLLSERTESEIESSFTKSIHAIKSIVTAEQKKLLIIYQTSFKVAFEKFGYKEISKSTWYSELSDAIDKPESFIQSVLKKERGNKAEKLKKSSTQESSADADLKKKSKGTLPQEEDHLLDDKFADKEFHMDQAGLILLHPFFKELFTNCKLINQQNEFIDQDRAVHLLHYLATKEELAFDHDLIFEKYCCGVPKDHIVSREIVLSNELKDHADELLNAVINHWKALKGTGLDTLRAEFLCRKGKLDTRGKHSKLIIERKTQDILLEKLPWSIGMAKFPWKRGLLFIEW
ncbi:hypothetical protein KZP23_17895 [Echinicola marina]|uniref:contractile injection system tape measure protein n=1 Tax=Echinicola marina TaxID=2859768 RepID=UPI001CF6E2E8|nr:contractile injection system tape measure protein [Echinicola marina]UCS92545.1 hypothetical protein KZP23_17895 [Echinicola marina]